MKYEWKEPLPESEIEMQTEQVPRLGSRKRLSRRRMRAVVLALICTACPIKAASALPPVAATSGIANVSAQGRSLVVPVTLCVHYEEGDRWWEESCNDPDTVCAPNTRGERRPDGGLQRTMCVWSARKLEELRRQSEQNSKRFEQQFKQQANRAAVTSAQTHVTRAQTLLESKDYYAAAAAFSAAQFDYRAAGETEKADAVARNARLANCRAELQAAGNVPVMWRLNLAKDVCKEFLPEVQSELNEVQARIDRVSAQKQASPTQGGLPDNVHSAEPAQSHIKTTLPAMPAPPHDGNVAAVQSKPAGDKIAKIDINPQAASQSHIKTSLPSMPAPPHDGTSAGGQSKPAGDKIANLQSNPQGTAQSHIKTALPGEAKSPTGAVATKEATCHGEVTSEGCIPAQTGKPNGPISVFIGGGQPTQSQPQQIKVPETSGPVNRPGYECKEWNSTLTACTGGWVQRFSIGEARSKQPGLSTRWHDSAEPFQLQTSLGKFAAIPLPGNRIADNGPGPSLSADHTCGPGNIWGGANAGCVPCSAIQPQMRSDEENRYCAQTAKTPVVTSQNLGCTCPDGAIPIALQPSADEQKQQEINTKNGYPPPPPCKLPGGYWNSAGPQTKTITWTDLDGVKHAILPGYGLYVKNGSLIVAAKSDYPSEQRPDVKGGIVHSVLGGTCMSPIIHNFDDNQAFNGWVSLDCEMWRDRIQHHQTRACPQLIPAPSASNQ